jgi:nitrite reductase (NADH) small subunit
LAEWKTVCALAQAPQQGEVAEMEVQGITLCVANRDGHFAVLENECPHRGGPLGQGWLEGNAVLCPWHAWAFDLSTGAVQAPEHGSVKVYPARVEKGTLEVNF